MFINIISDILNVNNKDYKSGYHLHSLIDYLKEIMLPNKNEYEKNKVIYDLNVNPIDYFKCMYKITELTQIHNGTCFNLFPQKVSMIQRYIKLDSTTIINILMTEKKAYYKTNIVKENFNIWNKFFKLDNKTFRKRGYKFNNSIITDGVSCSILFIKEEYYNKRVQSFKFKGICKEKYIDELEGEDYERIIEKNNSNGSK